MHKAKLKQTDVNKCTIKKPNCFHPRKCLDPKVRTFFSEEGPPAFNPLVASTSPLYHAAFPRHRIIVILSQKAPKVSHVGVFSTKVTSQHSRATTCGHYGFHVVATDYSSMRQDSKNFRHRQSFSCSLWPEQFIVRTAMFSGRSDPRKHISTINSKPQSLFVSDRSDSRNTALQILTNYWQDA